MRYRIEKDSIGEKKVPAEAYYGIQTLRSKENFQITKRGICRQLIKSLTIIKKAAAKTNSDLGFLDDKIAKNIILSCDEILNGRLHGQFITDLIQGGAGKSMNMNANEVIANRANEMMGGNKGDYTFIYPIEHVNLGQSTADVIPTAGKLAIIKQAKKLQAELKKLNNSYLQKAKEFQDIDRTYYFKLNELPTPKIGQEFMSFSNLLVRDYKRIDSAIDNLLEVNLGYSFIGSGENANLKYAKKIITNLNKYSGENFKIAKDLVDSTRHLDSFTQISSSLKVLASNLFKVTNDIKLLSSDASRYHEINLPVVLAGTAVIPDSSNFAVLEMINQVAFYVMGLDLTVSKAVEAGQLEINFYIPVILMALFEQISSLRRAVRTFRELTIDGITPKDQVSYNINNQVNDREENDE